MKRQATKYAGVTYRMIGEDKAYYIRYRLAGREVEESAGRASEGMTPRKAASVRAMRMAGKEASNADRRRERAAELAVAAIWDAYKAAHPEQRGRTYDESRWATHIAPRFGARRPSELTPADFDTLKAAMRGKGLAPATIQRVVALVCAVLRFGADRGLCPAIDVSKLAGRGLKLDNRKTECMSDGQLAQYLRALDAESDQTAAAALRLALATGVRKTALLSLEWRDIDMERGMITLRGETAKKGRTTYIPMSASARAVLEGLPRENGYVFPGRDGGRRMSIRRMATRVRAEAGLPADFRPLHGLRHTFASRLAESGKVELYTIQRLLTHESPSTTARYAHLRDAALRQAADVADSVLFGNL